jgi:hypothetical protein
MLKYEDGTPISDLDLIAGLLHMMVDHQKGSWQELEFRYNSTEKAMYRLRLAFESGEIQVITVSLANYFRDTPSNAQDHQAAAGLDS